jgi:hypothetical protein
LKQLKKQVKMWAKDQRIQKNLKLDKLEEDLEVYYHEKYWGLMSSYANHHINSLEEECNKILQAEEELWRQQSRAIWIKSGEQNTKFFHQFASHRRNHKYIWEIQDENGLVHSG